ncbi:MAG: acyl-CoA dehydrogenase domain protein [Actinomycetia bacterium]|nr:acyl-CoA dehydrogenase domain protein [Actinomycetes bacterium]MDQ1654840.1 hypothetical protein [Cryptosporangiaceae bacterium]
MTSDGERAALREAVRGLLAKGTSVRAAMESAEGYDRELWARLCTEIGVAALAIPERYGGLGAGPLETHVVLDELGRTLTPSPMLGSAVLAAQALLASGDDEACLRLLPPIASGDALAAVAWAGPSGHWSPDETAFQASSGGRLSGEAHYVLDGHLADTLLAVADGGLYEVDLRSPGVTRAAVTTMDLTRRLAVVRLGDVPARRLGAGSPLAAIRDVACVALSAEQSGATRRALELTVEHARTRVQFGQPIGAFQAIQHRLADLHVLAESARSLSYAAATALSTGAADASRLAAVAKVACSEAFERVAGEMIQLHGGIGITWEHDAHLYFKRAHATAHLFGHPRDHAGRLATMVLG